MGDGRQGSASSLTRPKIAAAVCVVLLLALTLAAALPACGDGVPVTGGPVGKAFPTVAGTSLDNKRVTLPGDFAGGPAIVLVAPSKESQADADKWIAALRPEEGVVFVETPVLGSLITRMMQGFINGKMREGEPRDMWPRIVPMYKDGDTLQEFFGDHGTRSTYVTVVDGQGVIRAFSTSGFSEKALAETIAAYQDLK